MIKHTLHTSIATLLITAIPYAGYAMSGLGGGEIETFDHMEPVSDAELSKMRGGFITPGGLIIDFAISTRTLVDNQVISDVTYNAETLQNLSSGDELKNLIQIGGNNSLALDELANNPNIGIVIQNSLDEKVIQQFSILDVTVENFTKFQANKPLDNALFSAGVNGTQ